MPKAFAHRIPSTSHRSRATRITLLLSLAATTSALAASGSEAPVAPIPGASTDRVERSETRKVTTWRSYAASARKTAERLQDDVTCTAAVQKLAVQEPDGLKSFALLEACARLGRFRELRLLFYRPWRRHLLELPPDAASDLAARVIAARGGFIEDDVNLCQNGGLFIETLAGVTEEEALSEVQYAVVRGTVSDRKVTPSGERITISESRRGAVVDLRRDSDDWYRLGAVGDTQVQTGRSLDVSLSEPLRRLAPGREYVYLIRFRDLGLPPGPAKGDSRRRRGKVVTLLGAYDLGVTLPDVSRRVIERGVDLQSLPVERYRLANGLTVILHEDRRLPLVHVDVTYKVGALHERPEQSGYAHLFEHMMFQGSANVERGQHLALLHSRGALEVNALTSFDYTRYYETVPRHELELALWLEADRMGFLLDGLAEDALENQKRVVLNERRERLEDSPYGVVDELIARRLYGEGHPYHGNVIGDPKGIRAASLADARAFYAENYTPSNATLVIAGDIEQEHAKSLVQRYFGTLSDRAPPPTPAAEAPTLRAPALLRAAAPMARLPRVSLVWNGPPPFSTGTAELDIVAYILDDTGWSMLAGLLRLANVDVRAADVSFREYLGGSRFEIHVIVGERSSLEEVVFQIDRAMVLLERLSLADDDMITLARGLERDTFFGLQTLQSRASVLQRFELYLGDPDRLVWDLERHQKVSPAGVQFAIKTMLGPNRLVVFAEPGAAKKAP